MTPWTTSSCLCLLVFLCKVEPSEEGCRNYIEDQWHLELSSSKLYVLLERELKTQETHEVLKHTLEKWCFQDNKACNILGECLFTSPPKCSPEKVSPDSQEVNKSQQWIELMSLNDFNFIMSGEYSACPKETIYECVPRKPVTAPPPRSVGETPATIQSAPPATDSAPANASDSDTGYIAAGERICPPHVNPDSEIMSKLVLVLAAFNVVLVACCIYLCYLRRRDRKLWVLAETSPISGDTAMQVCVSAETVSGASTTETTHMIATASPLSKTTL